ncbi:MAG: CBS domain-containing protein [Bacteroidetes bacterium QH_10_64_19]|nr:MAG: CBS domain-containing protein [Bacteroidetes bacterium QH_10_64_19]
MTVEHIMSRDVVTVAPNAALIDIRKRLHEEEGNHMLVLEDEMLRGVISDRDVLKAISPFLDTYGDEHRDAETLSKSASEIMQSDPITVTPDTAIEEASRTLLDNRVSSLPVVEGYNLMGIVTGKDMLEYYVSEES